MPAPKHTITDAEYSIMRILWQSDAPMTVSEVCAETSGEWSASTVSTFLLRLLKKGVIACEKRGKTNLYYPILKQSEYTADETSSLMARLYGGSFRKMVASLYENKAVTREEIDELKDLFDLE